MKLQAEITCPYCGHKNRFTAETTSGAEIYNCFVDEGGCDGSFVVRFNTRLTTTIQRIEGEEKYAGEREGTT